MSRSTFDVYHASAGAGKTYQLVYNFLLICLSAPAPFMFRGILAITFTNKAAREMKERIIRGLRSVEDGSAETLAEQLAKDLGLSQQELKVRCRAVLRMILHQYSAFSVSTIDKFTNRLIRSFASDLRLSVNYEIELNEERILQQAIDRMLSGIKEGSSLASILIHFLNTQLEEGKTPRAEKRLLDMGKSLFREDAFMAIKMLKEIDPEEIIKIREQLYQRNRSVETGLKEMASYMLRFIDDHHIDYALFNRSLVPNYLKKVLVSESMEVPGITVVDQFAGRKPFYPKSKAVEGESVIQPVESTLLKMGEEIIGYIEAHYYIYTMSSSILRSIFEMAVLTEIEKNLEEVKSENNRLPIGEFNKLISEKLQQQPSAFLYERIGDRYYHYFIDEFQDTSRLQWLNLVPLINNAMAQGGSAMLVGDAKQSIYRWRGGDVKQFLSLSRDEEKSNEVLVNEQSRKLYERNSIAMPNNYRSKSNVVGFNNLFFKSLIGITSAKGETMMGDETHRELYLNAPQGIMAGEGGYVEISLIDREDADQYTQDQCERCKTIVAEALAQGYEYRDIAILTRGNKQAAVLSEYLITNDVPVVSPDSLFLDQSSEVRGIVSFLHLLFRPDDLAARVDFLELLWRKALKIKDNYREKHLFLNDWSRKTVDGIMGELNKLYPGFSYAGFLALPLSEKVYRLMDLLDLNLNSDPFLQSFVDEVVDYEVNAGDGEAGFVRWWDLEGRQSKVDLPDELDAIRLMTIHKSKGLEFPVVIVAFADWQAFRERENIAWLRIPPQHFFGLPVARISLSSMEDWPGTEEYQEICQKRKNDVLLDNLNLLYVAFTRAIDQLYILGVTNWERQDSQRVSVYLAYFLEQQGAGGEREWRYGERSAKHPVQERPLGGKPVRYSRTDWHQRLSIATDSPLDWEGGEPDQTAWGKKLHGILAEIRYMGDVEEVIFSARERGRIAAGEEDQLRELISGVLQHPDLAKYFHKDGAVLNESEILLPEGKTLRPDRLYLQGERVHIIDYKTGVVTPSHRAQLDEYAAILEQMKYLVGDKVLIYLGEKTEVVKW